MPLATDPFALSALEAQPPFTFETAEKGVPLVDGCGEVGVPGVNQGPGSLAPEPAVLVRKLLSMAWVETPPDCRRPVSPGVDQQPPQHASKSAVAGRNLE